MTTPDSAVPHIIIAKGPEFYVVKLPVIGNNKKLSRDLRGIIGKRYNFGSHTHIVPLAGRRQLWEILMKYYKGCIACGPNGVFVIGEKV